MPRSTGRTGPRWRPLDDDEVLAWWEAFAAGESVGSIAERWERPMELIFDELDNLGVVLPEPTPTTPGGAKTKPDQMPFDKDLIRRALAGDTTLVEDQLMEAIAILRGMPDTIDLPPWQPVPTCRLTIHQVNARTHQPMSARERHLNAMASGKWRRIIARDLARAGLLPRGR